MVPKNIRRGASYVDLCLSSEYDPLCWKSARYYNQGRCRTYCHQDVDKQAWHLEWAYQYFSFLCNSTGYAVGGFNRLLKKCFEWFDKLTTNGQMSIISMLPPFALSLSKGEWRVFQQPVNRNSLWACNNSWISKKDLLTVSSVKNERWSKKASISS